MSFTVYKYGSALFKLSWIEWVSNYVNNNFLNVHEHQHCNSFLSNLDDVARVRLPILDNNPHTDYFNASYISVSLTFLLVLFFSSPLIFKGLCRLSRRRTMMCVFDTRRNGGFMKYDFAKWFDITENPDRCMYLNHEVLENDPINEYVWTSVYSI